MAEMRVSYRGLVGKREGKGPLVRPKRRWKYDIEMDVTNRMEVRGRN
jgi:hypothetical protein